MAISATRAALNAETGTGTSLVTFTFSEDPGTHFTLDDVVVKNDSGNILEVGANKDYTLVEVTGTGLTRTATLTPKVGYSGSMLLSIASGMFQDAAGNLNTDGADDNNTLTIGVDTERPTVVMAASSSNAKAGDVVTLTLTFSEEVAGLTTSDIVVSGGTGAVTNLTPDATDSKKYTVDFRPTAGQAAGTAIELRIADDAVSDLKGNRNKDGADDDNKVTIGVDTQVPTVSNVAIGSTAPAGQSGSYKAGDTITFSVTFSEAVSFSDSGVGLNFRIGNATATATSDTGNNALGS